MRNKIDGESDPVDLHVGRRINERRRLINISQEELAGKIGVSFQQVQKYSSGHNRVSASRLWSISKVLGVPISYFFEGLADATSGLENDPMKTDLALELVRLFYKQDAIVGQHIMALMRRLSQARTSTAREAVG